MCGNYIQMVKIVINNNIIEQVTDFKYICRFCRKIQNDHIQHKNKINGNVWELHTEGQNCDKQ